MISGYGATKRLLDEKPKWLPIVIEALDAAKKYREFAGSWVVKEIREKGEIFPFGPGLKTLAAFGILKKTQTSRSGRQAHYIMPDPEGVEKALKDIKHNYLTASHGRALRKIEDEDEMIEVSEKVKDDHLSSGQTEQLAGEVRIVHRFGDVRGLKEKRAREKAEEKRKKLTGDFLEKVSNFLEDADSVKSLNFIEILPEEEISELKENLKSINFKVKNIIKRLNFRKIYE